eukprot:767872-Hanusia_phi.AAC.1
MVDRRTCRSAFNGHESSRPALAESPIFTVTVEVIIVCTPPRRGQSRDRSPGVTPSRVAESSTVIH